MEEPTQVAPAEKLDVNIDVDSRPIADVSTPELMHIAWQRCDTEQSKVVADPYGGATAREFALAKTHLEDAITRFNKGVYRADGTYAITDAERTRERDAEPEEEPS